MTSYEKLLDGCVRYIRKHGNTQQTIDKLEDMLPGAWAAELIADALDAIWATDRPHVSAEVRVLGLDL